MQPNLIVDTRGMFCPLPVIKTSEALRGLDGGAIVEVVSDDPAIEHDLPAWCRSNGHSVESVAVDSGVFRYRIRKKAD